MSILGNLFGGGDSSNSSDFLSVGNLTGSIGIDYETASYENDDGEIEESWDSGSFGTDFDLGSILGSMSNSDSDTDSGGLF
jgi:hypothetical protein